MSRAEIPGTIVCDYELRQPENPRELILLLHGYMQSGAYAFRKFSHACPSDSVILAPSAPYPIPERRPEGGYRIGYSWYFYDESSGEYFIDPRIAIQMIQGLMRHLNLESLPKRIVGFSQGGYFAPLLASSLQGGSGGVSQVVGVASEFLSQDLRDAGMSWPPNFRVDAIHGSADDVVPSQRSQASHSAALAQGARGDFTLIPGATHRIGPEMIEALKKTLNPSQ